MILNFGHVFILGASFSLSLPLFALAQTVSIQDSGFESGMAGWTETDPSGKDVAISNDAASGDHSIKILSKDANIQQVISVSPNSTYKLTAKIKGAGIIGVKVGADIFFEGLPKTSKWKEIAVSFDTSDSQQILIFASGRDKGARFDDFVLTSDAKIESVSPKVISRSAGGFGLSPDLKPGQNFDLLGWSLSVPVDENKDGKADNINERTLAAGFEMKPWFYTGPQGGIIMRAPVKGPTTSKNTKNVRSELREMLRLGDTDIATRIDGKPNKNNWVFSSAPEKTQKLAGAVDGVLRGTLKVNHVTSTGNKKHKGLIVIGQIHARNDEPVKLFYRKQPGHKKGVVYGSHEPDGKNDIYFSLLGDNTDYKNDPEDGIALGEVFSYEIAARGNFIDVSILQDEKVIAAHIIDQTGSGYDVPHEFMYFKAGLYNQNNSGAPDDFAEVTFYELEARHP